MLATNQTKEVNLMQFNGLAATSAIFGGLTVVACTFSSAPPPQACVAGPPVTASGGWLVDVENVQWKDSVMPAHMAQLPQQYRTDASPQAAFAVFDLNIENATKQPNAWMIHGRFNKGYRLVSEDGTSFDANQNLSSIGRSTAHRNINPGTTADGTVVFDVPPGNYTFIIYNVSLTSGFATPIYRCEV